MDNNSLSDGRNIGESAVVCQGENLAQDVEEWSIAVGESVRDGMMCSERKVEHTRGLLRGGVLNENGATITLHATYRLASQTERCAAYAESTYGNYQKPELQLPRSERCRLRLQFQWRCQLWELPIQVFPKESTGRHAL